MAEHTGRDSGTRRLKLREYQTQLLGRVQAARTADTLPAHQLGVLVGAGAGGEGGVRMLFDLAQVSEIVSGLAVTPVPLTQPWYLGLANVRGSLVGVVDIARYLGLSQAQAPVSSQMVTFNPLGGFTNAMPVSRVFGLRHAAAMAQEAGGLRDAEGNQWLPFDYAQLVRDPRFLHVGL